MEILKMTRTNMVVIQTVEKEERNTFDIGKIRVAALPPIAKKDLIAELKSKGFCDGMIHTVMQCRLEDLNGYVNVWKYVAYILAVELMERLQNGAGNMETSFKFVDSVGNIYWYKFNSVDEARHFAYVHGLCFLGSQQWHRRKVEIMITRNTYPDGRTEIFCTNPDEYWDLSIEYDLEDCGMSGKYYGWGWSRDNKRNVDVYSKNLEEQKVGGKNESQNNYGIISVSH